MMTQPKIEYLKKNFDAIAILGVFSKVTLGNFKELSVNDEMVIQAFRRSKNGFETASLDEIGEYLSGMDEDSIQGVVSNVKGILNEIEYVSMENSDGDSVVVGMFEDTNHRDYDIWAYDFETGEMWVEQLKLRKDGSDIRAWQQEHPDDIIRVDEEMAEKLGLPSTGSNNEELEYRVGSVTEKLIDAADNESIWDYFPMLSTASVAIVVWGLYQRYQSGEITQDRFQSLAVKTTGLKVSKIVALMVLLSLPVVGVITGAALVYKLLSAGQKILDD